MKMKKLMIAAAAALWATVGYSDIESANIVGYTTKVAEAGKFIILGAQFELVAGGTEVNGLISGVDAVAFDNTGAFKKTAAQVQIPNALGAYTTLYYLEDGWFDDCSEEGDYKPGWCDGDGNIADTELTPGVAIWAKSVADSSINVAGAVPGSDSAQISCPEIFALRANTFPSSIIVNSEKMTSQDIVPVAFDDKGAFKKTAPQLQIPNALGAYTTLYYLEDGWFDDGSEEGDYKAGWCDGDGNITDTEIPAAQGFWTKGVSGAFTLTFKK